MSVAYGPLPQITIIYNIISPVHEIIRRTNADTEISRIIIIIIIIVVSRWPCDGGRWGHMICLTWLLGSTKLTPLSAHSFSVSRSITSRLTSSLTAMMRAANSSCWHCSTLAWFTSTIRSPSSSPEHSAGDPVATWRKCVKSPQKILCRQQSP